MERTVGGGTGVIEVNRDLALHPLAAADARDLYLLVEKDRERLREWLPWLDEQYSLATMTNYALEQARDNADGASLTACIRSCGEACGAISLHRFDPRHRSSSVGYWIASSFEGRGIMTDACRALVTEGFRRYGLHRIEIRCALGNAKSKGVPRRLGFREEGVLREAEWLYDHWVDLRIFSMLEQDWI